MKLQAINGTYGSGKTPCVIFTCTTYRGTWYAVDGSLNVNFTTDDVIDGVDVELLADQDTFTSGFPIYSEHSLGEEVEDYINN